MLNLFSKIPTLLIISLLGIGLLVISCEKDDDTEPDIGLVRHIGWRQ